MKHLIQALVLIYSVASSVQEKCKDGGVCWWNGKPGCGCEPPRVCDHNHGDKGFCRKVCKEGDVCHSLRRIECSCDVNLACHLEKLSDDNAVCKKICYEGDVCKSKAGTICSCGNWDQHLECQMQGDSGVCKNVPLPACGSGEVCLDQAGPLCECKSPLICFHPGPRGHCKDPNDPLSENNGPQFNGAPGVPDFK